ncbi:formimidoylglutamase [Pedobacter insulae]|uniref:Formiminoglutamase n=1 Tax=Pedobacter insulae TaxID=414048 RepID=A0A1I2XCG4_9SPHI|nr:formimidoylglutamase [Pedobacter insulae]SFH11214.1 formiminoglutamase [Pedobacter insulae]
MDRLKIYSRGEVFPLINQRTGEVKLGEKVQFISSLANLDQSPAKFVLLGIPEDIGVRANLGTGGTQTAWLPALKALLNMQSNSFFSGEEVLLLGHIDVSVPTDNSLTVLRNKVTVIDGLVYPIIEKIIKARKIPIVIGGGHNNALGIIWGASLALNSKMNVVNIDAHADLRTAEGRHSGNAFTYALQNGFLAEYRIFGLQQNYVSADLLKYVNNNNANIKVLYYEALLKSERSIRKNWEAFVRDLPNPCGLELDLDSIANVLSSAGSPSGFNLSDIRSILLSNDKKFHYLHICEGAAELADGRQDPATAKTIAILVSDFIKALHPHTSQQPEA